MNETWLYGIYYGVIALFLTLALTVGRRASCHVLWWVAPFMILGHKIGRLLRVPQLKLTADKSLCISFGTCTRVCPMSLHVQSMVGTSAMEHGECVLCAKCVDECPKQVLALRFCRPVGAS